MTVSNYMQYIIKYGFNVKTYYHLSYIGWTTFIVLKFPYMYVTTDMSVTEVASAVGIDNFVYFSRLFKREIGMSPREYKKMVNKPESLATYRISIYNTNRNIDIR